MMERTNCVIFFGTSVNEWLNIVKNVQFLHIILKNTSNVLLHVNVTHSYVIISVDSSNQMPFFSRYNYFLLISKDFYYR